MTLTPNARLAVEVIECALGVSPRTLASVRAREPRAATVQLSARRFANLLDALEAAYPGALDETLEKANRS